MGLFDFLKKPSVTKPASKVATDAPYANSSTNYIYNLLFCDDIDLYKSRTTPPYQYPFSVLFESKSSEESLQKIIDDINMEPRIRLLAYNKMKRDGYEIKKKELLAVIVEVGLPEGLDVLASFADGTARYINASGKLLVWENHEDAIANELIKELFSHSINIIDQIGTWEEKRKQHPVQGNTRITFLASDGLYFGEAATNVLFGNKLASPALMTATRLLQYVTETALKIDKTKGE